jgi:hypothetical protein
MLWNNWGYSASTISNGNTAPDNPILSPGRAHPVESRMRENCKYGSGREETGDCLLTFMERLGEGVLVFGLRCYAAFG